VAIVPDASINPSVAGPQELIASDNGGPGDERWIGLWTGCGELDAAPGWIQVLEFASEAVVLNPDVTAGLTHPRGLGLQEDVGRVAGIGESIAIEVVVYDSVHGADHGYCGAGVRSRNGARSHNEVVLGDRGLRVVVQVDGLIVAKEFVAVNAIEVDGRAELERGISEVRDQVIFDEKKTLLKVGGRVARGVHHNGPSKTAVATKIAAAKSAPLDGQGFATDVITDRHNVASQFKQPNVGLGRDYHTRVWVIPQHRKAGNGSVWRVAGGLYQEGRVCFRLNLYRAEKQRDGLLDHDSGFACLYASQTAGVSTTTRRGKSCYCASDLCQHIGPRGNSLARGSSHVGQLLNWNFRDQCLASRPPKRTRREVSL